MKKESFKSDHLTDGADGRLSPRLTLDFVLNYGSNRCFGSDTGCEAKN